MFTHTAILSCPQAMPISTGGITNHSTGRGSIGSAEAASSPARQPVSRTKSDGAALLLASTESGDTALSLSGRGTKSSSGVGTKERNASKTSKEKAEEVARKVVSLYNNHHVPFFFLTYFTPCTEQ